MKKIIILILVFLFVFGAGCSKSTASVKITTTPQNASIYIDGTFRGKAPLSMNLAVGKTYEIKASMQGFKDKTVEFTPKKVGKNLIKIVLLKNAKRFTVKVNVHYPYVINIDGHSTGEVTPAVLTNIIEGIHTISLVSYNRAYSKIIHINKDATLGISDFMPPVQLNKVHIIKSFMNSGNGNQIVFDNLPAINDKCTAPAIVTMPMYSNIYVGETVNVSGISSLKNFTLVFPSGKKVPFETDENNRFSKTVTFDELGTYRFVFEGKKRYSDLSCYEFDVLYRATPLPPTETIGTLFGDTISAQFNNAVALPTEKDATVKLFITDFAGKPVINKPIGKYGLKTDSFGIVTFKAHTSKRGGKIYINGKEINDIKLYGYILGWGYNRIVLDKKGKILKSTIEGIKDTDIVWIKGKAYVPTYFIKQILPTSSDIEYLKMAKGENPFKEIDNKEYILLSAVCRNHNTGLTVKFTDNKIEIFRKCIIFP